MDLLPWLTRNLLDYSFRFMSTPINLSRACVFRILFLLTFTKLLSRIHQTKIPCHGCLSRLIIWCFEIGPNLVYLDKANNQKPKELANFNKTPCIKPEFWCKYSVWKNNNIHSQSDSNNTYTLSITKFVNFWRRSI